MKLFTVVLAVSVVLAMIFVQRPAEAQAETLTGAATQLLNILAGYLPPQLFEIVRFCLTGFLQACVVSLLDLSRQVLYMCKSIMQDNPEFIQGLMTNTVFCTILFGAMGTVCPVIGNLVCGAFGFAIGIPIGLIDGCLRWVGYYNIPEWQVEAAQRQAEINKINNPQIIIIPA